MVDLRVTRDVSARIPTKEGDFSLVYYSNNKDDKEHVALVTGPLEGKTDVLVRIHSECFTGDVFGSRRCDCGNQLRQAMEKISEEGSGVVIYLRQEGRGIGLRDKLRAYNLQDEGYDTVDANIELGHQADERDYRVACLMLEDLGVQSVKLLTNNSLKINALEKFGIDVSKREPIETIPNQDNIDYLSTKSKRMGHMLDLDTKAYRGVPIPIAPKNISKEAALNRPFVTLTYAQSIDGSIALDEGVPFSISGQQANAMTHALRSEHDGILVGIGTIISDDPDLTVREVEGINPQPIILDTQLRFPTTANLLRNSGPPAWIFCGPDAPDDKRRELEAAGLRVSSVTLDVEGKLDLKKILKSVYSEGFRSIMVEGGRQVIPQFILSELVDHVVITLTPSLLGGLNAIGDINKLGNFRPRLRNIGYEKLGDDFIVWGTPDWENIEK